MNKSRSAFWDIMKGLGIIAVVVGHSGSVLTPLVYMYHLILFFYVSGYLYNDTYSNDPYLFIGKRIKSIWLLAVKYVLFFILIHNLLVKIAVYSSSNTGLYDRNGFISTIINSIFLRNLEGMGGALWFIPLLFFAVIGFSFIRWSSLRIKHDVIKEVKISSITILLAVLGNYLINNQIYFDYHLHLIFIVFPILQIAFLTKKYLPKIQYKWYLALISLAILLFIWYYTKQNIELSQSVIINIYVFYLVSIAGVYMNLYIASKILLVNKLSQLLSYIGNKSFHIMALHFLCFKVVEYFCYLVFKNQYSDISAYPFSHREYWVAHCICGIAIPTLILYCWERSIIKITAFAKKNMYLKSLNF